MNHTSNNDIARAIYLAGRDNISSDKIVQFFARRHLFDQSEQILTQLEKIINSESRRVVARVSSAKILTNQEKKELSQNLTNRYSAQEIILEEKINKKLLGGFRIEINDEVIDFTLRNKINKLEEFLTKPA